MSTPAPIPPRRHMKWVQIGLVVMGVYLIIAYLIMPRVGKVEAERHPDLRDSDHLTHTGDGAPGDPLNIALVGSEEELVKAFLKIGWRPADALTFRSSVRIAVDTVIDEPDPNAPVSNLYLYGRKEDLAF